MAAQEIKVAGRTFTVEEGEGRIAYYLTGKRGAKYGLLRNVQKPHCLFAVNCDMGKNAVPGWWFRDDGERGLRSMN